MRLAVFLTTAVIAAVISSSVGYEFGPLCCSNPNNEIRGSDIHGSGVYGAARKSKKHKGVDIKCEDGSKVYAPLDMKILRQSKPYRTNNEINDGIAFEAEGIRFKLWYIQPEKTSGTVKKGELIGTMLPMQNVYKGITSHVHFERYDKKDPASVINTQNQQENQDFCSAETSSSGWDLFANVWNAVRRT